jgi:hypothetical protein
MTTRKPYYLMLAREAAMDEITIHAPNGRPMASIAFWDEDDEFATPAADRAKADAELIIKALNAYRPRKPPGEPFEKRIATAKARVWANLRKPMPKATAYR